MEIQKRRRNGAMKALFVISLEQAKNAKLTSDKAFVFGDKVYVVIEDNAKIPGRPIQEAMEKLGTSTFSIA